MATVGILDTVAKLVEAFYRLTGSVSTDPALNARGESDDDIAYVALTRGARAAQRWMIDNGFESYWRSRSSAVTWSGTEASDGGRYVSLPSDFLRLWGDRTRVKSALVEADGDGWGRLIDEEKSDVRGDYYYLKGGNLWITRDASPPTTVYIEYHHKHPAINTTLADADIDFEMDARPLIVAEAAVSGKYESWFAGDEAMERRIEMALDKARQEARQIARRTRSARRFAPPLRYANHW